MKKRIVASTSGGRTSATMAKLLVDSWKLTPVYVFANKGKPLYTKYVNDEYEVIFPFANTSREDNRTLIFVENIKRNFNINCIWLEAQVNKGRIGTTHKIVKYETAKRDGSVFEDVIAKYGLPNAVFLHCTRELKMQPITSFCKSIGWEDYITAIGYRADEPKRVNLIKAEKYKQWYPLYEWGIRKPDVAVFWKKQSFDLGLDTKGNKTDFIDADGNCNKCYKKSDAKILYQVAKNPNDTWVQKMENRYGMFSGGRENLKPPYYFFRHNRTLKEIIEQYPDFDINEVISADKSLNTNKADFDYDLHEQESCAESCEPFSLENIPI